MNDIDKEIEQKTKSRTQESRLFHLINVLSYALFRGLRYNSLQNPKRTKTKLMGRLESN